MTVSVLFLFPLFLTYVFPIYLTVLTTSPETINLEVSSTQATVTWSAVTGGSPGEEVTEYNLCLIQGSDEVCTLVSADTLSYTLENLNPETEYTIRISAINAFGEGPYSGVDFTTGNYILIAFTVARVVQL